MEHKLIFFFFLDVSNINFSTLQGSGSSEQSIIHKVPNKAHGIHMILILKNMCPGCSGSHLNQFAVYHYSQGRANQSLPLLSCCLSWRGQTEQDELETWGKAHWLAGDTRQCSRLPRTFPKESFWKKDEPILNSNPLMHLASPSSVFPQTNECFFIIAGSHNKQGPACLKAAQHFPASSSPGRLCQWQPDCTVNAFASADYWIYFKWFSTGIA